MKTSMTAPYCYDPNPRGTDQGVFLDKWEPERYDQVYDRRELILVRLITK